jgi:DNA-binding MarR family transcriptional regulator
MDNRETLYKQKYIFGSVFLLRNKLQIIIDHGLADANVTTKQWFLMAVMEEFFDAPPALGELAEAMGSSHQNVKQIALKLQKKGFLDMEKDQQDRRVIRLKLTDKCHLFWQYRQEEIENFFVELFSNFNQSEINLLYLGMKKLTDKVAELVK